MKYIITNRDNFIKLFEEFKNNQLNEARGANGIDDFFGLVTGKTSLKDIGRNIASGSYEVGKREEEMRSYNKNAENEFEEIIIAEVNKRKGFLYLDSNSKNITGRNSKGKQNPIRVNKLMHYVDLMFEDTIEMYTDNDDFSKDDLQEIIYETLLHLYKYELECTSFLTTAQLLSNSNIKNIEAPNIKRKIEKYNNSLTLYKKIFYDDLNTYVFDYYTNYMLTNISTGDLKMEENFYFGSGTELEEAYTKLKKIGFSLSNFKKLKHGEIDKEQYITKKFISEYTPYGAQASKGNSFINSWLNVVIAKYEEVNKGAKSYADYTYNDYIEVYNSILDAVRDIKEINPAQTPIQNRSARDTTFVNTTMLLSLAITYGYHEINDWKKDINDFMVKLINETTIDDKTNEVIPLDVMKGITGTPFSGFHTRLIYDTKDEAEEMFKELTLTKKISKGKRLINRAKKSKTEEIELLLNDLDYTDERRILTNNTFNNNNNINVNFIRNFVDLNSKRLSNTEINKYAKYFEDLTIVFKREFKKDSYLKTFIDKILIPIITVTGHSFEKLDELEKAILITNILELYNLGKNALYIYTNIDSLINFITIFEDKTNLYKIINSNELKELTDDFIIDQNTNNTLILFNDLINSGNNAKKDIIWELFIKSTFYKTIIKNNTLLADKKILEYITEFLNKYQETIKAEDKAKEVELLSKEEDTLYNNYISKGAFSVKDNKDRFSESLLVLKDIISSSTDIKKFLKLNSNDIKNAELSDLFLYNKLITTAIIDDNNIKFSSSSNKLNEELNFLYFNVCNILAFNEKSIKSMDDINNIFSKIVNNNTTIKINKESIISILLSEDSIKKYFTNK